jgi:Flp pilus assembly protein TadD
VNPPEQYEALLELVLSAMRDGERPAARRHLVRARAQAGDDQLRGIIGALELVCDEADDHEARMTRLRDLRARNAGETPIFANAFGCTLSDVGERLDDVRYFELADEWFLHLPSGQTDPTAIVNHGIVLDRLERFEDAIAAFMRALEIDTTLHEVQLQIARTATRLGELERAAQAYRSYLAVHTNDAHEWISLAIVECDAGRIEAAEQAYWRAAGLEPTNVSLHYNWFISARRAGDGERARYAANKLKAVTPADWRTRMAEALVLEDAGDPVAGFNLARQLFLDLADESSDDEDALNYVACEVLCIASRNELIADARAFVEPLFEAEAFAPDVLERLRWLESAQESDLIDFCVRIDALYRQLPDPFGCIVTYRVFARDPEHAAACACAFETRCGADEVRALEVEPVEPCGEQARAGVAWRSGRHTYPADEFEP